MTKEFTIKFSKENAPFIKIFSDYEEVRDFIDIGKYKSFVWDIYQMRRNITKYNLENIAKKAKNKEEAIEMVIERLSEVIDDHSELFDF